MYWLLSVIFASWAEQFRSQAGDDAGTIDADAGLRPASILNYNPTDPGILTIQLISEPL
jgi:hypothetical protein